MIDTHAHLEACAEPADVLLARAREAGVDRVLTVAAHGEGSVRLALELAEESDQVYAIVGVHPHEAGSIDGDALVELREALRHPRAVALGETGLDFFRDYAPHDRQRALFAQQLELAGELEKPVVVHSRAADEETASMLASFRRTVVLHCFSSPGLLTPALERGYYVSFAGNVTYPKAEDLRRAAAEVPADRILAETDSPYLAPQAVRGRPNEPAHVVHTLAALAEIRGVEPAELAAQIDANATAAFALR